jgi:hypothetical protein
VGTPIAVTVIDHKLPTDLLTDFFRVKEKGKEENILPVHVDI